jgi:hypothetical protein
MESTVIGKTLTRAALFILLAANRMTAQDPSPLEQWDPNHTHAFAVGFGANTASLGVRFAESIGSSPVLIGVGVGREGVTPYAEIALGSGFFSDCQSYFGLGAWIGWGSLKNSGSLLIEFGQRLWMKNQRVFTDVGLAMVPPLWGKPSLGMSTLAFPRVQVGFTF